MSWALIYCLKPLQSVSIRLFDALGGAHGKQDPALKSFLVLIYNVRTLRFFGDSGEFDSGISQPFRLNQGAVGR